MFSSGPFAERTTLSARALSFLAACAVALVSGTPYLYSTYSNQLTSRLELTALEASIVGAGVHYGLFLSGPLFGRIVDSRGPKVSGLCSAVLLAAGYTGLSLTYAGTFSSYGVYTAFFFLAFIGMGSQAGFLTAVSTNAHNFQAVRGLAMGVPIACFGISALLFAQINNRWFKEDTGGFLLVVAKVMTAILFTSVIFLRVFPQDEKDDARDPEAVAAIEHQQHIHDGYVSDSDDEDQDSQQRLKRNTEGERLLNPNNPVQHYTHGSASSTSSDSTIVPTPPKIVIRPLSGFRLFASVHMAQMLFFSILLLSAPGLMYMTNAGAIIRSIYRNDMEDPSVPPTEEELLRLQQLQNYHVSLVSLSSCLGRISIGFMSDIGKRGHGQWWGVHRVGFLLYASICVWLGQSFGTAVREIADLAKVSILVGLGFGSIYGVAPTIVSEWFGVSNFGTNWGWISIGNAIGSQTFNLIFGTLYDREARHEHTLECFGMQCFHTSFILGTCSALVGVILLGYLTNITRKTHQLIN